MASGSLRPIIWITVRRHKLSLSKRSRHGREGVRSIANELARSHWEWSGNPAALGRYALRPVVLRPRLSDGFAFVGA